MSSKYYFTVTYSNNPFRQLLLYHSKSSRLYGLVDVSSHFCSPDCFTSKDDAFNATPTVQQSTSRSGYGFQSCPSVIHDLRTLCVNDSIHVHCPCKVSCMDCFIFINECLDRKLMCMLTQHTILVIP